VENVTLNAVSDFERHLLTAKHIRMTMDYNKTPGYTIVNAATYINTVRDYISIKSSVH